MDRSLALPLLLSLCFLPLPSSPNASPSSSSSVVCLDVSVPYPFGFIDNYTIGPAPLPWFVMTCDPSSGPMLLIGGGKYRVLNISLPTSSVRILAGPIAWRCRSSYGSSSAAATGSPGLFGSSSSSSAAAAGFPNLEGSRFVFSDTRNSFTAVGCDAMAMLLSGDGGKYSSGCVSFCAANGSVADGTCSGVGCCQAPMPRGLKSPNLDLQSIRNLSGGAAARDGSGEPCNKAFVVEEGSYTFSLRDLGTDPRSDRWPVVLEWSIPADGDGYLGGGGGGGGGCEEAKRYPTHYACNESSVCHDAADRYGGYRCNCLPGYSGNPYLPASHGGCRDIDECMDKENPCTHKCMNKPGYFNCTCPMGMTGDGRKEGSGCSRDKILYITVGGVLAFVVILATLGFWTFWLIKKRNLAKKKQQHFFQNGGLFLQQQIFAQRAPTRIFTLSELEIATNKFNDSNIVGRGGYGTVYKGLLSDQTVVAIKKSKIVDEGQMEQFINELVILSQIKHKNVVKLLGCCLETEVPLLVYEFISNGALFHHLHNTKSVSISWENRLRIAVETASALAYLHLATKVPIIHRDVKSSNILLDESYTTKVSDFGASRLIPYNQTHLTTLVQGTLGYLDPEYFQTCQLTDKSDVYSFGVVLVELLTREKPIGYHRAEEGRNLASHFTMFAEQNRLLEIVDRAVAKEAGIRHVNVVAQVALKCLRHTGDERPRMVEVAIELEALRRLMKQHMSLKCEKELRKLRDQSALTDNAGNFLNDEENVEDQIYEEEMPSLCHIATDVSQSESMDATLLMSMDIPW